MTIKLALLADTHANLPALRAVLDAVSTEACDAVFHLGDAIAIGPHPAECLDLLLNVPGLCCLMGNHESYFVHGVPDPRPASMSEGEAVHHRWVAAQLGLGARDIVAAWPYTLSLDVEGLKIALVHYALDASGRDWRPFVRQALAADLDRLFRGVPADIIFYGHDHRQADVRGRARYVNPGSLGCHTEPLARYCIATLRRGECSLEQRAVPYDDAALFWAFEQRQVPERAFIYNAFFGGRFST